MADPIVVKVSELTELTDLAAGDLITAVDVSEAVSANKTKKLQAQNIKLFTSGQLATSIVTAAQLANDAVETVKIKDLNVTTGKLANLAVTAAKIANGTITATQMAAGAAVANIATGGIATEKLADDAVTEAKLGAIKRTVAIPIFGREDAVIAKNFTRVFAWPPSLNGHIVTAAHAVLLGAVSSSGGVGMTLTNQNGAMATITIPQAGWSASASSISPTYYTAQSFATFSVNVTAAGTGAIGLTIYLEVLG
jgi:membrane-associated protease RseP (regulator of RpoE activity)